MPRKKPSLKTLTRIARATKIKPKGKKSTGLKKKDFKRATKLVKKVKRGVKKGLRSRLKRRK